jgi:probable phosphoglycerate mutase
MLLFLIRHALTSHTGHRLSGWMPDIHLSEEGERQVNDLVDRMRPVKLAAIYSSPLERTMETAKPLAASKRLRLRVREDLGEVRYGDWEGKRMETLARTKLWRSVQFRPSAVRFPNGETILETQARAIAAVERIRDEHADQPVAVVTHADVIRLLAAHYAGVHVDLYQRISVAPVSVSALWIGRGGPRILKLNDTGSLAELTAPARRITARARPAPSRAATRKRTR